MSLSFSCPTCDRPYEVADDLAGKRIKCRTCATIVTIPADAPRKGPTMKFGAPPPRPSLLDDGIDGDAPAGSRVRPLKGAAQPRAKQNWPLIIGLTVVAAGGVGAIGVATQWLRGQGDVGDAPPPGENVPPTIPMPMPMPVPPPMPMPMPIPIPPPAPAAPPGPPRFTRVDPAQGAAAPAEPLEWADATDPPAAVEPLTDEPVALAIPPGFGFDDDVLYPSPAGPFVALGKNNGDDEVRDLWDLRSLKRVGRIRGRVPVARDTLTLSPDGKLLAGRSNSGQAVEIWSFADGRAVGRLDDLGQSPDLVTFVGPDRLLVGSTHHKSFDVWDLNTGARAQTIATPDRVDRESMAVSPGGKYLATIDGRDATLRIFDLSTGRAVGEATGPSQEHGHPRCKGLAYSPDGRKIAGVFEWFGATRIVVWEAADGRQSADFAFAREDGLAAQFGYNGAAIEWLDGLDAFLVFGESVVDATTGQKVHSFPFDREQFPASPRRLLDAGRLLVVVQQGQARKLAHAEFPPELARKLEAVRAGGSATDAVLPAPTAADTSAVRKIAEGAPAAWSATPDPGPAAKAVGGRPIALHSKAAEVKKLFLAGADAAIAVAACDTADAFKPEGQPRWLDRYDLASGRHAGRLDLDPSLLAIGVSPDGGRALTVVDKGRGRLDAWSLTDPNAAHVVGWRPYGDRQGDDATIAWADFVAPDRVLTASKAGAVILWELPACKAAYEAQAPAGEAVYRLSPGRKWLAIAQGGRVRMIEAATGRAAGDSPAAVAPGRPLALAFRPDGRALLALIEGATVAQFDAASGALSAEFRSPAGGSNSIEWCGDGHALIDGRALIDLAGQRLLWNYQGGTVANGAVDSRTWFVADRFPDPAGLLAAAELPDPQARRVAERAADPRTPALLKRGARVTLQLDVSGPPGDPEGYRRELKRLYTERLAAQGIAVADGQPVKLVVRVVEVDTGQAIELRSMFPQVGQGPFGSRSIPLRQLEFEVSLADSLGAIPLQPKQVYSMRDFGMVTIPRGQDAATYLLKEFWESSKPWIGGAGVPAFVAREGQGIVTLPGTSRLGDLAR